MQMWTVDSGNEVLGVLVVPHTLQDPWFSIRVSVPEDRHALRTLLFTLATQLCAYLNSQAEYPAWLSQMQRIDETVAVHIGGYELHACGPLSLKHRFFKEQDSTPAAADKRARLMDKIFLVRTMS